MPNVKLLKRVVEAVKPGDRDRILWDSELKGFGLKVTPKGKRVYFVYYRTHDGQQRRPKIGNHGAVTCEQARETAQQWLAEAAKGSDPSAIRKAKKEAPLVAVLAERYMREHAHMKKKPRSAQSDESNLRNHVLPALGTKKVAAVTRVDIGKLHHAMKDRPGAGNRVLALLSKMFNLAEKWGLRPDGSNPCRHVERYPERKMERFLSVEEMGRLGGALAEAEHARTEMPSAIAAIRLLAFTGCRLSEVLALRWNDVDLERSCLRLPDSKTGSKVVRLSPPALAVLNAIERQEGNAYVIAGREPGSHLVYLQKPWVRICKRARLEGVRLHDLRHSFASVGAASGLSLPMIGALLGHRQPATTQRYAHLADDPLRQANDVIGERIAAAMKGEASGEVVELPQRRR